MGLIAQTVFGVFFLAVACLVFYISITDSFESTPSRLMTMGFAVVAIAVGIWLVWPLVLWVHDWWTGGERLAHYASRREAREVEEFAGARRGYSVTAKLFSIINVPAAILLAFFLRKDSPTSREWWFMPTAVLTVSGIVLAAWANADTAVSLPFNGILNAVNDSLVNAGMIAFLVTWMSIWMGTILTRLAAALAMGPIAAFVTPIAAIPYWYGYYTHAEGWRLALWWSATVVLGFGVKFVRDAENNLFEERSNQDAKSLLEHVSSASDLGTLPEYILFLRSFRDTGTRGTQVGEDVEDPLDLETILARAVRPRLLIGLGSSQEQSLVGAGRVYVSDSVWWDRVTALARRANAIIVVPSEHAGTLREIRWLREAQLMPKTLFVMPPTPGEGNFQSTVTSPGTVSINNRQAADQHALWSAAVDAIRDSAGIVLPQYRASGAVVGFDGDGGVTRVEPLDLDRAFFKIRKLRRALARLLGPLQPTG